MNNFGFDEKQQLVELLLKCPSIENVGTRNLVLQELPSQISTAIIGNPASKVHVLGIVNTCRNFPDGLEHLFKVIRLFDGATIPFQELIENFPIIKSLPVILEKKPENEESNTDVEVNEVNVVEVNEVNVVKEKKPPPTPTKATLSIDWLSGCSGCEVAFADLHEQLPSVLKNEVELVRLPILMDTKEYVSADIGMVTGSIRTEHDIDAAHAMRKSCKTIIALGTCPVYGGPHGGGYAHTTDELLDRSFVHNPSTRTTVIPTDIPKLLKESRTLDSEIKVDVYMPGCPPHYAFIIEGLRALLSGREPTMGQHNVCFDCVRSMDKTDVKTLRRSYEGEFEPNLCFLSQGILCFGSVALDRCRRAPCPTAGVPCFACGGPSLPVILEPQMDVWTLIAERMAHLTEIPKAHIVNEIKKQAKTHYAYAMVSPIFRYKPTSPLRKTLIQHIEKGN